MAFSCTNIPDAVLDELVMSAFQGYALDVKPQWYNFVCPFCGDLNRPNKKKAYVYRNTWVFKCHKCGTGYHILKYFKENDPDTYKRLLLLGTDDSDRDEWKAREREKELAAQKKKLSNLPFAEGEIVSLLDHHPLAELAVKFCQGRKIRPEVYEQWFVCQEGQQFMQHDSLGALVLDEKGKPQGNEFRNRLIIPFYKYGGAWNQFDARALDNNNPLRYRNFEGAKRQAYNIDFLDVNKPFYILEGTIDSTFVRNSIAIGGISHFNEVLMDNPQIEEHKDNCTIIWDNDEAGELARVESVKKGFKWFNWSGIKAKDINGAVLSGEMPVDEYGYVVYDFISQRSASPKGASILFALEHGDIVGRKQREQREHRMQLLQKMKNKQMVKVYF